MFVLLPLFSLICRCAIPVDSSWVAGFDRLAMESAALAFGSKRGTTQITFRPPKARGMRLKIADDRRALREKALAFDVCLDETDFPKFWSIFSLLLPTEGLAVSSKGILCSVAACLLNAQQINVENPAGTQEKKSPIPSSSLLASRRAALGKDRASMAVER